MLTKLKEHLQQLLSSQAKTANQLGFTPNAISVVGLVLSGSSGAAYALALNQPWLLLLAVILLLSSGFCDTLDGIVARSYNKATVFGGFFDSILDRYADAIIISGIIIGNLCDLSWGLAALFGSLLVSYSRAKAEAAGVRMESVGVAERAERMLILAVTSIVAIFWFPSLDLGIVVLAILSNLTVIQRGMHAYTMLKEKKEAIQT